MLPNLETDRLRLRPVAAEDLDHFAALYLFAMGDRPPAQADWPGPAGPL